MNNNTVVIQLRCDSICVGEYIIQVFWYISTVLYIMVSFIIIRYKKTIFKAPFWTLCISVGFSDINSLVIGQFYRLVKWGYFNDLLMQNPSLSAWILIIADRAAFLIQILGVMLLSLNRYTEMKQIVSSNVVVCVLQAYTIIDTSISYSVRSLLCQYHNRVRFIRT